MRLLIATPLHPPELGGPATYARALELGLPERGIDITLVLFSTVRHLPKGIRHVVYFWKILMCARRVDAVLALDPVSVGFPTMLACKVLRKAFFVKIVGDYAWEQGRSRARMWLSLDEFVHTKDVPPLVFFLRLIQKTVARGAQKVLVPSNYLKSILCAWGIEQGKIEVIHNAVPTEVMGAVPALVHNSTGPRIVTAGRLVPWKGIHGVITSMTAVIEKYPEAHLIIIGDGPDRIALELFAQARIPGEHVIFTGALSHPEALAVIASADVFVLNSTYEGLSHILIEAMYLARPIVATSVGGNSELLTDRETGLLVGVDETGSVSRSIIELLNNKILATDLGQRAKVKSGDFSIERMLDATSLFFKANVRAPLATRHEP